MSSGTAWETSKENVQPIKRGRSTKTLENALALQENAEDTTLKVISAFESELKASAATGADILDIYVRYFKYVRDQFPSNSAKAMQVLEKATAHLAQNKNFKNDIRFVKLWIEYADMVRTPGEIFSYMQANKIGELVSLFWAGWAFVAEKHENFSLADQIFQKGIKKGAEPKEMLAKRYQQYQRRMARRFLNSMHGEGGAEGSTADTAAGGGGAPAATAVRSATGRTDENAPNGRSAGGGSNSRSALGQLSAPAATSASNGATKSSKGAAGSAPKASRKGNGGTSFAIYTENDDGAAERAAAASSSSSKAGGVQLEDCNNPGWKVLGTEQTRRKENDGPATRWTEGGVVAPRPAAPAGSAMQFYVDEEFQQQKQEDEGELEQEQERHQAKKGVLAIRKALEMPEDGAAAAPAAAATANVDLILKNPLARHPAAPAKAKTAEAAAGTATKASNSASDGESAKRGQATAKPQSAAPAAASKPGKFAIFSDDPPCDSGPATAATVPVAKKASKQQSSGKLTTSSSSSSSSAKRSNNDPPVSAPAPTPAPATAGKFAIFCDFEDAAPAPAPTASSRPAESAAAKDTKTAPTAATAAATMTPHDKILSSTSAVIGSGGCTLSLSKAHDHSTNLSTASVSSSVGGATATINTKLAMMDIDLMFCDDHDDAVPAVPAPTAAAGAATAAAAGDTTADMDEMHRLLRYVEHEKETEARADADVDGPKPSIVQTPAAGHAHTGTTQNSSRIPVPQACPLTSNTNNHGTAPPKSKQYDENQHLLFTCGGVSDIKKVSDHGRDSGTFDYHQQYVGSAAATAPMSRRRGRSDSDSRDDGLPGRGTGGAVGGSSHAHAHAHTSIMDHDALHDVSSPSITFTATMQPATMGEGEGAPKSVGTTASNMAAGGAGRSGSIAIYEDSPQRPLATANAAASSSSSSSAVPSTINHRSKRPKKLNECWAGIDDLLADDVDAAPAGIVAAAAGTTTSTSSRGAAATAAVSEVARSSTAASAGRLGLHVYADDEGDDDTQCLTDLLQAANN